MLAVSLTIQRRAEARRDTADFRGIYKKDFSGYFLRTPAVYIAEPTSLFMTSTFYTYKKVCGGP